MNDANQPRCPQCGAALPARAPEGLCPRCLGALNLGPDTVLTGEELGSALPLLSPAELAPHFPQLEILECLGRGGMGVVYKARQKSLDRMVALKLLAPGREQDPTFAERFAREAQALARLSHPSIVTVHDFGRAGDFYFLLMEFVDGVNLRQLLRSRKLTPEEALAIVPPLCDALQYAHERGIVHRDIKPENLLLDKTGRVKIADFGIAKMLGTNGGESTSADAAVHSTAAGTPQYMAPEQKSAPQQVDSRADIYSLGVVFYEMLTGELPDAKLQPPSRKVQVNVRLDEIVLRALEVKPEMRFATAADFRAEIAALTHTPIVPPPFQPGNHPWVRHWDTLSPLKRLMIRRCLYVFALLFTLNFVAPHLSVLGDGSTRVWTAGLFPHPWLAEMERATSGGNHQAQLHVFFTRFTFISGFLAAAAWIALGGVLRAENGPGLLRLRGEPDAHGQRPVLVDRVVLAGLALLSITSLASTACLALFAAFTGDAPPLLPSLIFNLCPTLWVLALAIFKGDSIRPPANPRLGKRAAWIMVFALACIAVGLIAASIHFMRVERQKLTPPRPVVVDLQVTRSVAPKGERIIRKDASVMLVHDDVDVHYALFTKGAFDSTSRSSYNQKSLLWMDDGDLKLLNGRTFGYQRESVYPEFLRVNGQEFDLRKGRVIELREDGTIIQKLLFPSLAEARLPETMTRLVMATDGTAPSSNVSRLGSSTFAQIQSAMLPYGSTLDFSSGAVGQMPGSLRAVDGVRVPEDQIYNWMKGTNADVAYPGDGNFYGMMLNMVTFKRAEWDNCTADQLAAALHGESSDLRVRFDQNDPDKYTFGFKNGEGRLGLLQITGFTKSPRGVQVRYKLVEASRNTTDHLPNENWLKMSYQEFDQSLGKHWRELADVRRFPEAARMIEQYLAVHPELEKGFQQVNGANLHFHAGQCRALAGEKDAALKHLAVAHYSEKWVAVTDLHWNEYVAGTEAFLRGDRAALIQAHENLSHAPEENLPNLRVLDRLLADFNKSYAEAYEMHNQDHKKLSAECFNRTWELLEKKNRTPEENEQMISLAHASLAHWRQREDCQPRNLSIGYWQISRVYAVLGQAENAARYGDLSLDFSGAEPPFYVAYAHEALARAAKLKGDAAKLKSHLESARELAAKVTDAGERKQLLADLDELGR